MRPRGGQAAPNLLPVPLPPLLYGHAVPAIASKAYAIGGAIPQPPSFIPLATDPISSTVYVLDVPAALQGTDSPWTVDASANLTVNSPATLPSGVGSKPPPLLHHCAVPVAHRILVLFGQTVAPDGSRVASNYPPLWFDPAEGTWSPLKQDGADWITPNPRYMHSCAFHGATARVFVFGGIMKGDDGKEVETNELWTLDVNDGWWEQVDLERINGVSLERRRVGSSMHIVNGASNYLFICFGAPSLVLKPNDPGCHILDISGVYPANITLLPSTVLAGKPPVPRMNSAFSTKIPYENSVMFGYGGYDGSKYLEDIYAIDASGLPSSASWIPVVPTPQYPNPKRFRPGPRADYGRLVPLPLPVQTPGMPQPQLLWGGSTGPLSANTSKGTDILPPMLPNASESLGTLFSLDPATWGWSAAYPVPHTPDEGTSLWSQPWQKWVVAGVCLAVAVILAVIMVAVCVKRGGCSDPKRMNIPIIGRCWRPEVTYDEEDAKKPTRTDTMTKYPKVLGTGELLVTDPWKTSPTTNQVSPGDYDDYGSPVRRSVAGFAATLGRSFSMKTGNNNTNNNTTLKRHSAMVASAVVTGAGLSEADAGFLDTLGPHASAAFERRSLITVGSKRDNLAAAAAAGLLAAHPGDRHSRTQSKRQSAGGLPTGGSDSEDSDEEPATPPIGLSDPEMAPPSVPMVPTRYIEELPAGMTLYDLFSTPQPPPSEPALLADDAATRPPPGPPGTWEGQSWRPVQQATRILTYDLNAGTSGGNVNASPTTPKATKKMTATAGTSATGVAAGQVPTPPPKRSASTGAGSSAQQQTQQQQPVARILFDPSEQAQQQQEEGKLLVVSNPDMARMSTSSSRDNDVGTGADWNTTNNETTKN